MLCWALQIWHRARQTWCLNPENSWLVGRKSRVWDIITLCGRPYMWELHTLPRVRQRRRRLGVHGMGCIALARGGEESVPKNHYLI